MIDRLNVGFWIGRIAVGVLASVATCGVAAEDGEHEFLTFVREQARELRSHELVPETREQWQLQRQELRRRLTDAWGAFPTEHCPLEPKLLETLPRDGYRIEKWILQTLPDVWMTANCYVPDKPGRHPAILAVHGHWRGAKQDPVPQKRFIGPAKLGYVGLAVDAFGAGERGIGKALGEYHGEMVAATLFPVGLSLAGLQVYENMRAVDFLQSRDDVDPLRIGITGASGGGNQSMYAGAWDERFRSVVPVCSVGNYQAYLGNACCMCEVVPGALTFTEEWSVLALTAPRGLMVVNATKDAIQFSVAEARTSLANSARVYELLEAPSAQKHAVFDWHHDYSQAMRESMYGWMNRHLRDAENDAPVMDPEMVTEDPELLRCFPGESRPDNWMTIPRFAAREARKQLENRKLPTDASQWNTEQKLRRQALEKVLGGVVKRTAQSTSNPKQPGEPLSADQVRHLEFESEPGIRLVAEQIGSHSNKRRRVAIILDCAGGEQARSHPATRQLQSAGWSTVTLDLRACGHRAWKSDTIGRAPDHNTAEWSLWIGRPLAGQWVVDVLAAIDALEKADNTHIDELAVVGIGPAGVISLAASALDPRISHVITIDSLASYVTDTPYVGQRLGIVIPRILPEVGDIAHLAALSAARHLVVSGGVAGNGTTLSRSERDAEYVFTRSARMLAGISTELIESSELLSFLARNWSER